MERWEGVALSGWDSVLQSIGVILTTPIGSRVMRRDFGSELPALIGRPMTPETLLAVYSATAEALERWESRFRLVGVRLIAANAEGRVGLELRGEYQGELVDGEVTFR